MIHLKLRKKRLGNRFKSKTHDILNYEIDEIFLGRKTIFLLMAFTVGGILIGRTLWEYGKIHLGLPITMAAGFILFAVSGAMLGKFK